jgi:hypothetical protein
VPSGAEATIDKPNGRSGCTGALVTGLTSLKGNMVGQCVDLGVGTGWPGLTLVTPKTGNRYLLEGESVVLINEKGVCRTQFYRAARKFPPYPGTPEYLSEGDLMRLSDSAAEYVALWSENVTKYGTPKGPPAYMIVDAKEGYLLEQVNFIYGDPENHNIIGPMTDNVFASANFFVSERLKAYEAGIGLGYTRAKRLWEMLIDRQYDSITMQPSDPFFAGSGISLPYFMSCFRDHGSLPLKEGRMSGYVPEERGQGALCIHGISDYTNHAFIGVARADHTELFSCEWMTPNQPCISPFLPLYIGINDVPEALGTSEAFNLFEELRLAVEYHPEYRVEVTDYWKVFEIQTIEKSYGVEREAGKLSDAGKEEEARKLLTKFCEDTCNDALAVAQDMLKHLNKLPILGETAVEAGEE